LEWVTIIHPHHPLFGQRVEVVRRRRGADPDLIIRLADGTHAAVAASLTDDLGLAGSDPALAGPLPLLDVDGLRRATQFIHHLRQIGRFPESKPIPSDNRRDPP
jgi:hypothetical protein